jgi:hypothetical protein
MATTSAQIFNFWIIQADTASLMATESSQPLHKTRSVDIMRNSLPTSEAAAQPQTRANLALPEPIDERTPQPEELFVAYKPE